MCGIVAYIGNKEAYPILIKGLERLEYRGYDSAGVALLNKDIHIYKKAGKVQELKDYAADKDTSGSVGIGHTRWATHGEPNQRNAHPHFSTDHDLAIIHNGIIENYAPLKEELIKRGHKFISDTDTEVLIHLIEDVKKNNNVDLLEAVRIALNEVTGAYAIVVLSKENPNQLIGARKGSPLVVGLGENDFYIASDATPIIEYTKNVVYLDDEEIALLDLDKGLSIKTIANQEKTPYVQELEMKLELLEKGGYEHFMLKEIYEQPRSIYDSMRGRIDSKKGDIYMGGMHEYKNVLMNAERIIITACGTSWHAALVAEYLFEDFARIPVEVEYASEFRYRNPVINRGDVVIAISQSGETADTLAAIEIAKQKGATVFGVCNVVGASIPRATHAGAYTHAGPEIGVASTKAFTAQVTVLIQMALWLAYNKGTINQAKLTRYLVELEAIPAKVEEALKSNDEVKKMAKAIVASESSLYLGRGYNFPVALEGALKLKEISYIHAEGYPAAEMKHGPIALIDENLPVVVLATKNSQYDKMVSNIQEVKARKGRVFAVVTKGDTEVKAMADRWIEIPDCPEELSPLVSSIPLQLLSYHVALMRGCNVDQPRNLAKSVTVE
ncbi:MAG: glutamine--fructose-6-phosphate transaminase (isomerizing) [Bacteroidetes bacterium]|nr:glutamine--fructose-6-phosphate transaminase (isomerizing) [Bacteroidota bacterium]MCB9226401.1 glutamine--fructose-6-phosphate transaminase (isomerizing) [Chitinophagales bacterium]